MISFNHNHDDWYKNRDQKKSRRNCKARSKADWRKILKIRYRTWAEEGHGAQVYRIPYGCCRYRLENGRISIDVSSDKASESPNPDTEDQKIASYLKKDQNKFLKNLLKKDGQRDPAIITADGFLINGNRRRLIIEELYQDTLEDKFKTIEVIILPEADDADRPTLEDIAMLEYREQVEADLVNLNIAIWPKL